MTSENNPPPDERVLIGEHLAPGEIAYLENALKKANIDAQVTVVEKRSGDKKPRMMLTVPVASVLAAQAITDDLFPSDNAAEATAPAPPTGKFRWGRAGAALFAFMVGMRIGRHFGRETLLPFFIACTFAALAYGIASPGESATTAEPEQPMHRDKSLPDE